MTKRQLWVLTCVVFAAFWAVLSLFLWFLVVPVIMIPISLLMIMIPVGVSDEPKPFTPRHNANAWRQSTK